MWDDKSSMLFTSSSIHAHGNKRWRKAPNYFSSLPLELALFSVRLLAQMELFYRKVPLYTRLPAINAWWG